MQNDGDFVDVVLIYVCITLVRFYILKSSKFYTLGPFLSFCGMSRLSKPAHLAFFPLWL